MTLDQMLTDLNSRIGSEPEINNANLTTWINQGLLAFCNAAEFSWLEKKAYASTVANQIYYSLPSDAKRVFELKVDGDRYTFVPYEQRDMQSSYAKYFTVFNNQIILNPVPETTSSQNIELSYFQRVNKMVEGSDSPSDSDIANMPEVYHEALVIYAFSIYNTYDEEHGEAQSLMGNEFRPLPGTFYWFVKQATKEEQRKKKGARRRMLGAREYHGYNLPNSFGENRQVLV